MTENPFVVDQEEWREAGLWKEGSYKFQVLDMRKAERERKDGGTYPVIAARLAAVAQAEYDGEGNFSGILELERKPSRFQDFGISGSSLQMLKTLYKTMTGRYPEPEFDEETGRYGIDTLKVAQELVGHSAWNVVYWTDPEKDENGNQYDRITYTFTSNPRKKIKVKKQEEED